MPWDPPPGQPRIAQISSFSLTGSNAGLVLEEPRQTAAARATATAYGRPLPHCLLLSAADEAGLSATAGQLLLSVRVHADALPDLCRTLQDCRPHRRLRAAVVGRDAAQLAQRLQALAEGRPAPNQCVCRAAPPAPQVVFLLPDEPDLYAGAALPLYHHIPAFRDAAGRCAAVLEAAAGRALLAPWLEGLPPAPDTAHGLQFLLQYALCRMWQAWGVEPAAVLGRGVGEYVAAVVAGLLPLDEAARLVVGMAPLFRELSDRCCSVRVVPGAPAPPHAYLTGQEDADVCVLSAAPDDLADCLTPQGGWQERLPLTPGLHSAAMAAVWSRVQAVVATLRWAGSARVRFAWGHAGRVSAPATAAQWAEGWQAPSRWRECLEALVAEGVSTAVVMGLHSVRSRMPEGLVVAPGLDGIQRDLVRVAQALAVLHTGGVAVPWGEVYGAKEFRKVRAPGTMFSRVQCKLKYDGGTGERAGASTQGSGPVGQVGGSSSPASEHTERKALPETENNAAALAPQPPPPHTVQAPFMQQQHSQATVSSSKAAANDIQSAESIYDEMLLGYDGSQGADREDTLLRFGPFPFVMPGFSWMKTYTDGEGLGLSRWAQLELRATAFRYHDLRTSSRVLDFGCGMGTDLMELATLYPQLKLDGYTISGAQAQYGQRKAAERGVADRVTIHHRDSTKDEFPHTYDMAFAFEVVHHILDKDALFAHLSRHIREGGHICFADFISNDTSSIDHKESSSFFIRAQDWVELYSKHGFRVDDVVDISHNVASYLYDPDFETILAAQKTEASRASLISYDRLGRMLYKKLSCYVLLSASRDTRSTQEQLYAHNKKQLEELVNYSLLPQKPHNIMYELNWVAHGLAVLPQYVQRKASALLIGPIGPASQAVLALKALLQEQFNVVHAIHQDGSPSMQVGGGNVFAMDCNQQQHWRQLKSQVGTIHIVIDAQGWKETTAFGPALHVVHATVEGMLSELKECNRFVILSEDARMAGMAEGYVKSLTAEVSGMQAVAVRTQQGTPMQRIADEIRNVYSGDRESAVWLPLHGDRLVRRLQPHPLCMKVPMQMLSPKVGSYLITGGTGGIGLEVARFLAMRGARHIVLTSRRPPASGSKVHQLPAQFPQTQFLVEQVDVANAVGMQQVVDRLPAPLVGIMHCAGVMYNIPVMRMTADELDRMLVPKVQGTMVLHQLSEHPTVQSFVLFSSIASAVGNPLQCGYAAANGFMDGFAEWRLQQGMPCTSVQWGAWAEAGMASDEVTARHLKTAGVTPMSTEQAISGLEWVLCQQGSLGASVMTALVDWSRALRAYPRMEAVPPLLGTVASRVIDKIYEQERVLKLEAAAKRRGVSAKLSAHVSMPARVQQPAPSGPSAMAVADVERRLGEIAADVLQLPVAQIDPSQALATYEMDSLMALELRQQLSREFGITLSATVMYDYPSLEALAPFIVSEMNDSNGHSASSMPSSASTVPISHSRPSTATPEQVGQIQMKLLDIAADVLQLPVAQIDPSQALATYEMDSLMALELRQQLSREFGITLSATVMYDYPSLEALAPFIVREMNDSNGHSASSMPSSASTVPISHSSPSTATPEQVWQIQMKLLDIAADVLQLPVAQIDPSQALATYEMDSLMALELRQQLSREFGITLSATVMYDYPSLEALAPFIVREMNDSNGHSASSMPSSASTVPISHSSPSTATPEQVRQIQMKLLDIAADVLQLPVAQIDPSQALATYEMDSLMALELRQQLSREFGITLSATVMYDYPSLEALAPFIVREMKALPETENNAAALAPQPPPPHTVQAPFMQQQHSQATVSSSKAAANDIQSAESIYDEMLLGYDGSQGADREDTLLRFGPFPFVMPGFSWMKTYTDGEGLGLSRWAQLELRATAFRYHDLRTSSRVLDFGCGMGTDLMELATLYPQLKLDGYTISGAQAQYGQRKAAERGVADRVTIHHRDSTKDEFPHTYDMAFAFEVVHHILDKDALFAHLSRHIREGGHICFADFISNDTSSIDHKESSSFFIRAQDWVELYSKHGFRVDDVVDISHNVASYLYDPDFETILAAQKTEASRASLISYDRLGRMLYKKLSCYVLLSASRDTRSTQEQLYAHNKKQLEELVNYSLLPQKPHNIMYELNWVAHGLAVLPQYVQRKASALLIGPIGPASQAVLALKALLQEQFNVVHAIHQDGSPSMQVGGGNVFAMDCNQQQHWRQLKSQVGTIHIVIDAQGWKETTAFGPALHVVHATVEGMLSELKECNRFVILSEDARMAGMAEGYVKSLTAEVSGMQAVAVRTQQGTPMQRIADEIRNVYSGDRESAVWLPLHGDRLVRRLQPHPLCMKVPMQMLSPKVGSYLITGGTGGIGLEVARFLAMRGARHIVLTSRRPPASGSKVHQLPAQFPQTQFLVEQVDVANAVGMQQVVDRLPAPLVGIMHCAGVMYNIPVMRMTAVELDRMLVPKVQGTMVLHQLSEHPTVQSFVLFSSIASAVGNPLQCGYAAANGFMDGFAEWRLQQGMPCTSVQWGAWAEAGMASDEVTARHLKTAGVTPMSTEQAISGLEWVLCQQGSLGASVMTALVDWSRALRAYPRMEAVPPLLGTVASRVIDKIYEQERVLKLEAAAKRRGVSAKLSAHVSMPARVQQPAPSGPSAMAVADVERRLGEIAADVLQLPVAQIDPSQALATYEMDSLMALELRQQLSREFGITLSATVMYDYPSLEALAPFIVSEMNDSNGHSASSMPSSASTVPISHSRPSTATPEQVGQIQMKLLDIAADVLQLPVAQIDPSQALATYEMDSLMALELRQQLSREFGITLSATVMYDYPSLEALAPFIVREMKALPETENNAAALAPQPPPPHTVQAPFMQQQHSQATVSSSKAAANDIQSAESIYDEMLLGYDGSQGADREDTLLRFGPFPFVMPGFSWMKTYTDGEGLGLSRWAQLELRATAFRYHDLRTSSRVLDFGCGMGTDLMELATLYPQLKLDGYTISGAQAQYGQRKAAERGVADRVTIHHRDSTKDEFPHTYDMAFAFEVVHHILDKDALFAHLSRHIREGGHICFADFISNDTSSIDHKESSSFFIRAQDWVELYSKHGFRVDDVVDISHNVASYLYDPDFETILAAQKTEASRASLISYDRLGRMLYKKLSCYVLLSASRDTRSTQEQLYAHNKKQLEELVNYSLLPQKPHNIMYELNWVAHGLAVLPQYVQRKASALLIGPIGPASQAVLALKALLQEQFNVVHAIHQDGSPSMQVGGGNVFAMDCNQQQHWRQLKSQVGTIHIVIDAQGWKETTAFGPALHVVHATVEGMLSELKECNRFVILSEDARMAGMAEGYVKSLTAEVSGMQAVAVRTQQGTPMQRIADEIRNVYSGDRESAVWLPLHGDRLVRRLQPHPLCMKVPMQMLSPKVGSYLITGGTGGIGLEVARFLAMRGARHIVLTSRRPPASGSKVHQLPAQFPQTQFLVEQVDVANAVGMQQVVDRLPAPLVGIMHCAGVMYNIPVMRMTAVELDRMLVPKVQGTMVLHQLSEHPTVQSFVLFSSIASAVGNPLQCGYAAANGFMDGFAEWRLQQGMPCTSVQWGAWAEAGMASDEVTARHLKTAGVTPMSTEQAISGLEWVLCQQGSLGASVMTALVDWSRALRAYPRMEAVPPLLGTVASRVIDKIYEQERVLKLEAAAKRRGVSAKLSAHVSMPARVQQPAPSGPSAMAVADVERRLGEIAADVLQLPVAQIDPSQALATYEMDSLMALELRQQLSREFGITLSATVMYDYPSLEALAPFIVSEMNDSNGHSASSMPSSASTVPISHSRPSTATPEQVGQIQMKLLDIAADVLQLPVAQIDPSQALATYEMDSLMALELRQQLSREFGITLSATVMYDYPSLEALAPFIVREMKALPETENNAAALAPQPPPPHTVQAPFMQQQHSQATVSSSKAAANDIQSAESIYDEMLLGYDGSQGADREDTLLRFGPFPFVMPGFSWMKTYTDGEGLGLSRWAQLELRATAFRYHDLRTSSRVLDFGCGMGTDLMELATLYPQLKLDGYTISGAQAQYGQRKAAERGVADRVTIHHRDSTKDEFPHTYDMAFAFEVVHHILDKDALFAHLSRHIREGGHICFADFISNDTSSIDHKESSSFFIRAQDWVELYSKHGFRVDDVVDISHNVASYLYDPDFETILAAQKTEASRASLISYDRLGRMLYKKLSCYVLLSASRDTRSTQEQLYAHNKKQLEELVNYSLLPQKPHNIMYELNWVAHGLAVLPQYVQRKASALLIGPIGPASQAVLALKALLQEQFNVVHAIHQDGSPSMQVGGGNVFAMDCNQQQHWRQLKSQVGTIHIVIDAQGWKETTAFGPALHVVHATVEGMLSELKECNRFVILSEDARMAGMAEGYVKSLTAEVSGMQAVAVRTQQGTPMQRIADEIRNVYSGDRESAVWLPLHGDRLVRRLQPHPLCMKVPMQMLSPKVGSYLITGGTGGIGLEVARFLAMRGARHIVLTSRRPPASGSKVHQLPAQFPQTQFLVEQVDVANAVGMQQVVDRLPAPLVGIMHCAGVMYNIPVMRMTAVELDRMLVPKVQGTMVLHQLLQHSAIRSFVLFSSIASAVGNPLQCGYAAANGFMDGFAEWRLQQGMPCTSVQWGAWAEAGMASDEVTARHLKTAGVTPMSTEQAISGLEWVLCQQGSLGASVMTALVDWSRALRAYPRMEAVPPLLGTVASRVIDKIYEQERVLKLEAAAKRRGVSAKLSAHVSMPARVQQPAPSGPSAMAVADVERRLGEIAADITALPMASADCATLLSPHSTTAPPQPLNPVCRPAPLVSIAGISLKLPGACTVDEFWDNMMQRKDGMTPVPPDRWDNAAWFDPRPAVPGKLYTRAAGFVEGIGDFDAGFFGLSDTEARCLDPQQRLLLELSWQALEDAVIVPHTLHGSPTAVYVGVSNPDYALRGQQVSIGPYSATGTAFSCVSGRISYTFRLRGPSLSVDTACSASAVCAQLAFVSLQRRESSLALAMGVNAMLDPSTTIALCQVTALSANNRTASFAASADGYSRGEGAAVAVLQRVDDMAPHQRPHAVVAGAAVAQDGHSQGLTAPSGPAQQQLMRGALAAAGLTAEDVGYVEMHATGTVLGDPIEMESVRRVYGRGRTTQLAVSCGKTNIGHLESAAGMAGLIRCALVTTRRVVPPLLHLTDLNPHFPDLPGARITVPAAGCRLPAFPCTAANSFGFSGTLANILLRPAPPAPAAAAPPSPHCPILTLSAASPAALRLQAARWAAHLSAAPDGPATVAGAQLRHRTAFPYRLAAPCSAPNLVDALEEYSRASPDAPPPPVLSVAHAPDRRPRVAFVFGGLKAVPVALGQALCRYAAFRALVRACDQHLHGLVPPGGVPGYFGAAPGGEPRESPDSVVGHVAHFVLGYGLASLLTAWGLRPAVVYGPGQAEFIAACVAGLLPFPDAVRLVARRAALLLERGQRTTAVLVRCSRAQAQAAIAECGAHATVAVSGVAAANTVALVGVEGGALAAVQARLPGRGFPTRAAVPYHTALLRGCAGDVQRLAQDLPWGEASVPVVSGTQGALADPIALTSAAYWGAHVWQPPALEEGLKAVEGRADVIVELGVGGQLLPLVEDPACVRLCAVGAPAADRWSLAPLLARLFALGVALDWAAVAGASPGHTPVPRYAFDRRTLLHPPRSPPPTTAAAPPSRLYQVAWEPAPGPSEGPGAEPAAWLVVAERPVPFPAAALVHLPPAEHEGPQDWGALVQRHRDTAPGVVFVAGGRDAASATVSLRRLVQLLQAAQGTGWTVVVVTTGGQPPAPGLCPAQAPLPALVRAAAPECPGLRLVAVDVPELEPGLLQRVAAVAEWGPHEEQYWGPSGVLAPRLVPAPAPPAPPPPVWQPRGWYVLTGGLGGVGTATALAMARAGARDFAFVSRSGAPPRAQWEAQQGTHPHLRRLLALEAEGARVRVLRCDTADRAAVREVLLGLEAEGGVRGVLHMAGVPGIADLLSLTPEDCAAALRPKVLGSDCLSALTQELCPALSCFVLFSSTAALFGGRRQALYAASNRYLDALGLWRARQALPATAINWGMWAASVDSDQSAQFIQPVLKVPSTHCQSMAFCLDLTLPYLTLPYGNASCVPQGKGNELWGNKYRICSQFWVKEVGQTSTDGKGQ